MGIINLAMTCKTDTNSVFISGNEKATKVNSILRHECKVRNICVIDNKHASPRFHCNKSGLHLNYHGIKKYNFSYELAKLDWQVNMVGIYTLSKDSITVTSKNKGKRKRSQLQEECWRIFLKSILT